MTTALISVLFLCTPSSRSRPNPDFNSILAGLNNKAKFALEECKTYEEASKLLKERKFEVVIVHFLSSEATDLWRRAFHKTRAYNKFSEVIVIVADQDPQDKIDAGQVLSGGCFAFFQYRFSKDVLFGYIEAAYQKYEVRQMRAKLSRELNDSVITSDGVDMTVKDTVEKIAFQLYELTKYNIITIVLLKKGIPEQGYLRKLVYTNVDRSMEINWKLLGPTAKDSLVNKILLGELERRIFSNPRNDDDIKMLFDAEHLTPTVNSWIALPLRHDGIPIGLITLDGFEENQFNYDKINELFLEQIANQAAAAIRYAEKAEVHQRLGKALNALNSSAGIDEILEKLAEQACELVGGLFSYIVVPDQAQTRLEFKAAWSRNEKNDYIKRLKRRVAFFAPGEKELKPGFLLPPYNSEIEEPKGITTLAFATRKRILLENIRDEGYEEVDKDAREHYFPFAYLHKDRMGNGHTIFPSSDIALPILLEDEQFQSSDAKLNTVAVGVINVEHEKPYAFTIEQISALEQLAEFAAIAIQKWKKQEFVSDLYDISSYPYQDNLPFDKSIDNMEIFLHRVAENIKTVSKAIHVSVHVVKDNKSFSIGKSGLDSPQNIREGSRWGNFETEGHTFWSVRNQKAVIINDTTKYSASPGDYTDIFGESYIRKNNTPIEINPFTDIQKIKALVCIPMIIPGQKVIGVIWMHHETRLNYTKEEIRLLEKFASNIANTLNVVEKITFLKIENEIGSVGDKEKLLENIVESAKVYFGIRGAVVYEANHQKEELRVAKSSFSDFSAKRNISFSKKSPDGLTGHLMLGINKGDHLYATGIWHVQDYRQYVHAMDYTDDEKEKLGSLIGIRFPLNVPPSKAVGVLVIADAPVVLGKGGREYNSSMNDLIRFANVAGRCLQAIAVEKSTKVDKNQTPEDILFQTERKYNHLFDISMGLLGLLTSFILMILFQNLVAFSGITLGIKIFITISIFFLFLNISSRLRKSPVVTTLASILLGVLTNLLTEWLSW